MRKKIFTLLLTLTMICGFSMSALAGSKTVSVKTSGGYDGVATVTFHCFCGQETIPTRYYYWNSYITAPSTQIATFGQNGKILLSDDS